MKNLILLVCIFACHLAQGQNVQFSKTSYHINEKVEIADVTDVAIDNNTTTSSSLFKTLTFTIQKQAALNLCWAAVASSVSKFYDPSSTFTQCKLANQAFKRDDCCTDLTKCDAPFSLDEPLKYTGNFVSMHGGAPSFDLIKQQITNGRLVCVRIEWRSGDGHFVVIHGFHDNGTIDVQDPWPERNPGTITLLELELFYKDLGAITDYYLTKPQF
ncbi:papain-like cysteine protease family protein [Ohtaekwangia koreensis]|uniref:Peptidase_C39 like family protein n=1 Tax=Ohtaekwangia koreensis TaxID=688867 RepID=A0A1T5J3R4_9BACT|nr:papain-like cysteine protease family protein [Ohtaekwangia koreensis]SKC45873.1 Peptidase_C39 like family protein [Ohtaekwangia koreensis]